MKYHFEDVLCSCIDDVRAGRNSIEGCLVLYPQMSADLRPLMEIATSIQKPQLEGPARDYRIRSRMELMEYLNANPRGSIATARSFPVLFSRLWYTGWSRAVAISAVLLLLLSGATAGTVQVAAGSLPGEVLYPVKLFFEDTHAAFVMDDHKYVLLEMGFAGERLSEITSLGQADSEVIAMANEAYQKNISRTLARAEGSGEGEQQAQLLDVVASGLFAHIDRIDLIYDKMPEANQYIVRQTLEMTLQNQFQALRSLAIINPLRATQINLVCLQNRLARADNMFQAGLDQEAEQALEQYRHMLALGEEISGIAHRHGFDLEEIQSANLEAIQQQSQTIGSMQGKTSDQAVEIAGNALQHSYQYHSRVQEPPQEAPEPVDGGDQVPGSGNNQPNSQNENPGNPPGSSGEEADQSDHIWTGPETQSGPGSTTVTPGDVPDGAPEQPDQAGTGSEDAGNKPEDSGDGAGQTQQPTTQATSPQGPGDSPQEPSSMQQSPGKE